MQRLATSSIRENHLIRPPSARKARSARKSSKAKTRKDVSPDYSGDRKKSRMTTAPQDAGDGKKSGPEGFQASKDWLETVLAACSAEWLVLDFVANVAEEKANEARTPKATITKGSKVEKPRA